MCTQLCASKSVKRPVLLAKEAIRVLQDYALHALVYNYASAVLVYPGCGLYRKVSYALTSTEKFLTKALPEK